MCHSGEDLAEILRDAGDVVERPALGDLLHQGLAAEPAARGDLLEDRVDEGQVPVLDVVPVRDREEGFDARGAARDDADRPCGGDGRDRRVPERGPVGVDALLEVREWAALDRQVGGCLAGGRADARHHLLSKGQGFLAVVGDLGPEQEVRPAHHAESDPPVLGDLGHDVGQGVGVDLDHVVQEPYG